MMVKQRIRDIAAGLGLGLILGLVIMFSLTVTITVVLIGLIAWCGWLLYEKVKEVKSLWSGYKDEFKDIPSGLK